MRSNESVRRRMDWIFAESMPYQFCLVRYSNENKRRFLLNAS